MDRTCFLEMDTTSWVYLGTSGDPGTCGTGSWTVRSFSFPLDCMLGIVISVDNSVIGFWVYHWVSTSRKTPTVVGVCVVEYYGCIGVRWLGTVPYYRDTYLLVGCDTREVSLLFYAQLGALHNRTPCTARQLEWILVRNQASLFITNTHICPFRPVYHSGWLVWNNFRDLSRPLQR